MGNAQFIPVILPNENIGASAGDVVPSLGHAAFIQVSSTGAATFYEYGNWPNGTQGLATTNPLSGDDANVREFQITAGTIQFDGSGNVTQASLQSALDQVFGSGGPYAGQDPGVVFATPFSLTSTQSSSISTAISNFIANVNAGGTDATYSLTGSNNAPNCINFVYDMATAGLLTISTTQNSLGVSVPTVASDNILAQNGSSYQYISPYSWEATNGQSSIQLVSSFANSAAIEDIGVQFGDALENSFGALGGAAWQSIKTDVFTVEQVNTLSGGLIQWLLDASNGDQISATFGGAQSPVSLAFSKSPGTSVAQITYNANGTDDLNSYTSAGALSSTLTDNTNGTSQVDYFTGLPSGVSQADNSYTGANGTGTFLSSLYDYTAGTSTNILLGDLPSGDTSIFDYYTGLNETGTFFQQDTNYAAGNSLVEFFNPTNTIATEFEDFTGASGTGTDTQNTLNWDAGGSQVDYFTGLPSGVSQADNSYTGANGTGTFLSSLYDYTAGTSTNILLGDLPSGDTSIFDFYTGLNETGTFFQQDTNYAADNSLVEFFNPTNSIATEFQHFTATSGTGTDTENLVNWDTSGSQEDNFVGLPSGVSETVSNYTGANATGTFTDSIYDYTAGNSTDIFVGDLPSGDSSIFDYYRGLNDTGTLFRQDTNYTAGSSLVALFNPTGTIETQLGYYSGASGTGTYNNNLIDWDSGGSQDNYFTGLPSGTLAETANYSGANNSGTLVNGIFDYSGGTSTQFITGDLPSGVSLATNAFAGENDSGRLVSSLVDNSNNTSIDYSYVYNGSGELSNYTKTYYDGSSELGVGQFLSNGSFYNGYNGSSDFSEDNGFDGGDGFDDDGFGGDGGYSGGGYGGGYQLTKTANTTGTNIGVIAEYDANQANSPNGAQAAEAAQLEAQDVGQLQASGSSLANAPFFEGAKWNSNVITWSLATSSGTAGSPFSDYMGLQDNVLVAQAFQAWGAATGLTFEQVEDSGQSDIRIGWGSFNTSSSGVLGYTSYIEQAGQMQPGVIIRLEDPSETSLAEGTDNTLTYTGTQTSLYQVILHEIGHALGLADNGDPNSVMYYQALANNDTLDSNDLLGIRVLYDGATAPTLASQANNVSAAQTVSESSINSMLQQLIQAGAAAQAEAAAATSFVPQASQIAPTLVASQHA